LREIFRTGLKANISIHHPKIKKAINTCEIVEFTPIVVSLKESALRGYTKNLSSPQQKHPLLKVAARGLLLIHSESIGTMLVAVAVNDVRCCGRLPHHNDVKTY
jgi:hypothetical protein